MRGRSALTVALGLLTVLVMLGSCGGEDEATSSGDEPGLSSSTTRDATDFTMASPSTDGGPTTIGEIDPELTTTTTTTTPTTTTEPIPDRPVLPEDIDSLCGFAVTVQSFTTIGDVAGPDEARALVEGLIDAMEAFSESDPGLESEFAVVRDRLGSLRSVLETEGWDASSDAVAQRMDELTQDTEFIEALSTIGLAEQNLDC